MSLIRTKFGANYLAKSLILLKIICTYNFVCFILFQKINKKFCIYSDNSVIISAIGKFSSNFLKRETPHNTK